jgi:hypothetical protein
MSWKKEQEKEATHLESALRWLVDVLDELDIYIANREFEHAVALVENARARINRYSSKSAEAQQANDMVKGRVESLATVLERDFRNPITTKLQLEQNIDWMLRMDLAEQARESFLSARSVIIRQRVNQLVLDGTVLQYIKELAVVIFTMIRNTTSWYNRAFTEPAMASAFMKWVKHEIDYFADLFRKRVFFEPQKFHVIASALRCALDQCSIMKDAGLDMAFLLERLFFRNICDAVDVYIRVCVSTFDYDLQAMDSIDVPLRTSNGALFYVSRTTEKFYNTVVDFENDLGMVINLSLYEKAVISVGALIDSYVKSIIKVVQDPAIQEGKFLLLSGDIRFILDYVLPFLSAQLSDMFGRPITEIQTLKKTVMQYQTSVFKEYGSNRSRQFVFKFNFDVNAYTNDEGTFDQPSSRMTTVIQDLHELALKLQNRATERATMVTAILEGLFNALADTKNWEGPQGNRQFGFAGNAVNW